MKKSLPGIFLIALILLAVASISVIVSLDARREKAVTELLTAAQSSVAAGDPVQASAHFEEVLEKSKADPAALFGLFDIHAFFDRERGADYLRRATDGKPDREALIYRHIRLAEMEGDFSQADDWIKQLEALESDGREAQLARLLVSVFRDESAEATAVLADLASAYPQDRFLKFILGSNLAEQESLIAKIQAKDRLMELLEQPDEFSFKSAIFLLGNRQQMPLFESDYDTAVDHLLGHPFLQSGLDKLRADTIRALTARFSRLRPDFAYELSAELLSRDDTIAEDRLLRILSGQLAGNLSEIEGDVQALLDKESPTLGELLIGVRQRALENRPAEAMQLLDRAEALDPEDSGADILESVVWLVNRTAFQPDDAAKERLVTYIFDHPQASEEVLLLAAEYYMANDLGAREPLVQQLVGRLRGEGTLRFHRWLNRLGEYALNVSLLPREDALQSIEGFSIYCDALIGLNDLEEVQTSLEMAKDLLEPWRYQLFLSRIHVLMDRRDAGRQSLLLAMQELPKDSTPNLFAIANLAKTIGESAIQKMALSKAHEAGLVFPIASAMDYLGLLLESKSLEASLRFAAYCHNIDPTNPLYINNLSYLRLLQGKDIGNVLENMKRISEVYPQMVNFRLTLALAELVGGYPGEARETLESVDSENPNTDIRSQLVSALVLAGTGDRGKASSLLGAVDLSLLMEQERALINRYVRDGSY